MAAYDQLVNKGGTIFNKGAKVAYNSANQLAADLGVNANQINWGSIASDNNFDPTGYAGYTAPVASSYGFNSTPNPNSPATTSGSVRTAAETLNNDITTTSNKSDGLNGLLELFSQNSLQPTDTSAIDKLYSDRQSKLEERRAADFERINAEYDLGKSTAETRQAKELEPIQSRLDLLKDTPYGDKAAIEEDLKQKLFGLQESHKQEMSLLYNRRESSLATARTAYEDNDFKLAELQLKNAKDAEDNIYNRQKDFLNLALQFTQENRQQQQIDYNMSKDNKDFVISNGINSPMYWLGGKVFDSSTGGEVDPTGVDWKQVQIIDPGSKQSADYVKDLATKYPDAKIDLKDTPEQAQAKLVGSKIYKEQIRPPQSGGGNSPVTDSIKSRYNLPSYVSDQQFNTVRDMVIANKTSNPNVPYYELWGNIAEDLRKNQIDPGLYDGLFWEYLAPAKGTKTGYDQWAEKTGKDIKTQTMMAWQQQVPVQ